VESLRARLAAFGAPEKGGSGVLIPTFIVRDMMEAIAFHTGVLDFQLASLMNENAPFYAVLTRGQDELHLSLRSCREPYGHCSAIVICEDVDALFAAFKARGLTVSARPDSPVHEAPLDQTWGTREVYIDDPSGNTLCFQQR
jgi:catechol 2,3-dioxygenase-like lactoylglutathione lyase family enzyme